jgi:hypothetical protein
MNKILVVTATFALLSVCSLRADPPAALVFSLQPANVGKVVVLMYKGPKITTLCEVTFDKAKQAELAQLATQSAGKPITILVNGKAVTQTVFAPGKTGHSIKFPCASPEEALATAKTLLAPSP